MINKVTLNHYATYTELVEFFPKKLNFFYGSNGSGKTTISNVLGDYITSPGCGYQLSDEKDVKVLVYNKSFVDKNFHQSSNVKGIFTLGEDSIEAQDKLDALLEKCNLDSEAIVKKLVWNN